MIEEELGDGSPWGIRIRYSHEGDKLLGTGGAVVKALPLLTDPFFVLYGDSYLPIDYQLPLKAFLGSEKKGLMTVYRNENRYDKSNVWFENNALKAYSKTQRLPQMRHIDYGLSLFSKKAFEDFKLAGKTDLSEVFGKLFADGELAAFEVSQRFYEIGSPEGLLELEGYL